MTFTNDPIFFAYITFPNQETATHLCHKMVKSKLIACANIFAPHVSIYQWKEETCTETEVAAIVKTTSDKITQVEDFLLSEHPYDTPAIAFWPIIKSPPDFTNWVKKQTS